MCWKNCKKTPPVQTNSVVFTNSSLPQSSSNLTNSDPSDSNSSHSVKWVIPKEISLTQQIIGLDLETFGLHKNAKIYELALITFVGENKTYPSYVHSNEFIPISVNKDGSLYFHNVNLQDIQQAPTKEDVKREILEFLSAQAKAFDQIILIGHNAKRKRHS